MAEREGVGRLNDRPVAFISHHSSNVDLARHVKELLAQNSIDAWLAPDDIDPGQPFDRAVSRQIRDSDLVILLLCSRSDQSPHVKRELMIAEEEGKRIYPVRLETIDTDGLAYWLKVYQWFDWMDRRDETIARMIDAKKLEARADLDGDHATLSFQIEKIPALSAKVHGSTGPEIRLPIENEHSQSHSRTSGMVERFLADAWYWSTLPLRRYAEFRGRSRPKEFWAFMLFENLMLIAISLIVRLDEASMSTELETGEPRIAMTATLAMIFFAVPAAAVTVRRLHDTNRSGWLGYLFLPTYLIVGLMAGLGLMPIINAFFDTLIVALFMTYLALSFFIPLFLICVFAVQDGTAGPNRFGEDPLGRQSSNKETR